MITATVVIDLGSLKRYASAIDSDLRRSSNKHVRAALRKWAARYRAFVRERFSRLSRGGGEWPQLAVSTLMRRRGKFQRKKVQKFLKERGRERALLGRKIARTSRSDRLVAIAGFNQVTAEDLAGNFKARASILIDTGTLFAALDPVFSGKPGQFEEDIDYGVSVGFGGRQRHPGGKTVEEIAMYHQTGGPNLPQRTIIVPPDQATMDGMAKDMEVALDRTARENGNT